MEGDLQNGRHQAVIRRLCAVGDIADGTAKGFELRGEDGPHYVVVIRRSGQLYGYVNSCPHIGTPLDLMPDRFLTEDGTQLLCSTHGARFDIETGLCTDGPCQGDHLQPVPVAVDKGQIVLQE
jgi:nitrite reductase/ring-hydroxylating ferredoxin subunit